MPSDLRGAPTDSTDFRAASVREDPPASRLHPDAPRAQGVCLRAVPALDSDPLVGGDRGPRVLPDGSGAPSVRVARGGLLLRRPAVRGPSGTGAAPLCARAVLGGGGRRLSRVARRRRTASRPRGNSRSFGPRSL